jgi:hypothetical protein
MDVPRPAALAGKRASGTLGIGGGSWSEPARDGGLRSHARRGGESAAGAVLQSAGPGEMATPRPLEAPPSTANVAPALLLQQPRGAPATLTRGGYAPVLSDPTAATDAPGRCGTSTGNRDCTARGGTAARAARTSGRDAGGADPAGAPCHARANTCSRRYTCPVEPSRWAAHSGCMAGWSQRGVPGGGVGRPHGGASTFGTFDSAPG